MSWNRRMIPKPEYWALNILEEKITFSHHHSKRTQTCNYLPTSCFWNILSWMCMGFSNLSFHFLIPGHLYYPWVYIDFSVSEVSSVSRHKKQLWEKYLMHSQSWSQSQFKNQNQTIQERCTRVIISKQNARTRALDKRKDLKPQAVSKIICLLESAGRHSQ